MWCHTRRIPSSDETSDEFSQRKSSCCSWGDSARQNIFPLLYSYLNGKKKHSTPYSSVFEYHKEENEHCFETIRKLISEYVERNMASRNCKSGVTDDLFCMQRAGWVGVDSMSALPSWTWIEKVLRSTISKMWQFWKKTLQLEWASIS